MTRVIPDMPREAENATRAAIARGQADVLAADVTPHPKVAATVQAPPVVDAGPPAIRAVVWSHAARDAFVARVQGWAKSDAAGKAAFVRAVDLAARGLGRTARGVVGLVPQTYEAVVPGTPSVLAFELVTWTKAGEVIAILHLFDAPRDIALEAPLWP